ncbi:ABC transporter permease [Pseudoduganella umbonata]|uniref:ABC transporter permease n=1 Tax=Pseudoduganella umbonata TaxID=864828 RepID=A0A4P8I041_9BURK|nr:ABC transporter permease [Pseudoduganella umbonata]MBB3224019.1 sulfonate transport system permease protein [Pseudoduganella umbonata]QCP14105.1 ABC transporter permease [Pseudoduganella umbonata]
MLDLLDVTRFRPARPQPGQARQRPPLPRAQTAQPSQAGASAPAAAHTHRAGPVARWLAWRWSAWTSPLLLLAVWSLATALGWAPEQILVSPLRVLRTAWELALSGELAMHLEVSLLRLLGGFAIGAVTGIGFGLALGLSPRCRALVGPTFEILRQLPSVALIPLFILLFGIGESFKVLIVVKSTFFIVALAGYDAVANLSQRYLEVARIYCFTRWQVVRRVVLPAIMPAALTGMRIALSRSWMVLVGAELMAAESGLGQMMEMARQMFRLDVVMVGVVLTGGIGFALDRSLRWLEAYLGRWQRDNGKDAR